MLVLGAGEMAQAHRRPPASRSSVKQITIVEPHVGARRADGRAHRRRVGGAVGGARRAPGAADIVITATGAAAPILTQARIEAAMRPRRNRPLFIIDIALPRDVEAGAPAISTRSSSTTSTTCSDRAARTSRAAANELARAEAIVDEEVERFASWMQSRGAVPTVVALRQRFETIRRAELDRLEPKLAGLPPEARARIDEITRLIVEKLLLTPTEQLKGLSDEATATRVCGRAEQAVQPAGDR